MCDRTPSRNATAIAVTGGLRSAMDLAGNSTSVRGCHAMPAIVGQPTSQAHPTRSSASSVDLRTALRVGTVASVAVAAWLAVEAFGRPYT
jgi:hypothetical protein